jgi:cell division protein ZapA (FtsZ GTPase activity inhibitor)
MNPSSGKTPATTISFTIYGQRFQLLAAPEEHERIRRVAEAVDAQIQGQRERAASELRSILMAAYQIGYELDEIESQTRVLAETQQQLAKAEQTLQTADETTDRLIERIDRALEETVPEPEPVPVSVPTETVETPEVPVEAEATSALEAESVEAPCPVSEESEAGAVSTCTLEEAPVASTEVAVVDETAGAPAEIAPVVSSDVAPVPAEPVAESVSTESALVLEEPPTETGTMPESAGTEALEPEVQPPRVEAEASVPEREAEPEIQPLPDAVEETVEAIVGPESADQFVLDATPPEVEPPTPLVEEAVSGPSPEDTLPVDEILEEEPVEPLTARVSALFEAAPRMEPEAEKPPVAEAQPFVRPSVQDLWGAPRPASPEPEKPTPALPPEPLDTSEEELAEMEMRLPDIEMELDDVEFGIQVDEPFELEPEAESAEPSAPLFGLPSVSNHPQPVEAGWPAVESFSLDEPSPTAPQMEPFDLRGSVPPTPPTAPEIQPFRPTGSAPQSSVSPRPPQPTAQPYPQPQIRPNPLRAPQPASAQRPAAATGEKHSAAQPARQQNPTARPAESPRLFESSRQDRHAVPPLAPAQDTRVRPSSGPEFKTIGAKPWMRGTPSAEAKPFETRNFLFGSPDKKNLKPPIFHETTEKKPRNAPDDLQPSLFHYLDERLKKSDPQSNK